MLWIVYHAPALAARAEKKRTRYASAFASSFRFFFNTRKYPPHRVICTIEEQGVARPTWKRETGVSRLMAKDTGMRTPKAPTRPWTMTKPVRPMPLK